MTPYYLAILQGSALTVGVSLAALLAAILLGLLGAAAKLSGRPLLVGLATALVSLIGLQEMTYIAKQASAATRSPFAFFLFTATLFLLYTTVSLYVLRKLNARYSLGSKRTTR